MRNGAIAGKFAKIEHQFCEHLVEARAFTSENLPKLFHQTTTAGEEPPPQDQSKPSLVTNAPLAPADCVLREDDFFARLGISGFGEYVLLVYTPPGDCKLEANKSTKVEAHETADSGTVGASEVAVIERHAEQAAPSQPPGNRRLPANPTLDFFTCSLWVSTSRWLWFRVRIALEMDRAKSMLMTSCQCV